MYVESRLVYNARSHSIPDACVIVAGCLKTPERLFRWTPVFNSLPLAAYAACRKGILQFGWLWPSGSRATFLFTWWRRLQPGKESQNMSALPVFANTTAAGMRSY